MPCIHIFLLSIVAAFMATTSSVSFGDEFNAVPTEEEKQEFIDVINTARANQGATGMNELVTIRF